MATLLLPVRAQAQAFQRLWQINDPQHMSDYTAAAFIKNDRTVYVRSQAMVEEPYDPFPPQVICLDHNGNQVWSYQVPEPAWGARAILTTTDDRIYVNFGAFILALTQDGQFVWRYGSQEGVYFDQMRIYGDNLFVKSGNQAGKAGCLSLNRQSGALSYSRVFEELVNWQSYFTNEFVSNGTHAFFRLKAVSGESVITKIDPENGDIVGRYSESGFEIFRMVIDSVGNLYVAGTKTYPIQLLRKIDASGSGSLPVVWEINQVPGPMVLSKGYLYLVEELGTEGPCYLSKLRPSDGSTVWTVDHPIWYRSSAALIADKYGRIYLQQYYYRDGNNSHEIIAFDPVAGEELGTTYLAGGTTYNALQASVTLAFNSNAEIFVAGGFGYLFGHASRIVQPMEPQPDTYNCNPGEVFSSAGNGVIKNDRYVHPSLSTVTVEGPPPLGILNMASNGEFTYDATGVPPGLQTFTYQVERAGLTASAQATLIVAPFSIRLNKDVIAGQNSVLATLRVTPTAEPRVFTISDDSSFVSSPASITIPAGQSSATFRVQVQAVNAQINAHLVASMGGTTRAVPLTLLPLIPTAMAFSPSSSVSGGDTVTCRVVVNGVAGPGGRTISIFDNSIYSQVPTQVVVPAGASEVSFIITTTVPASPQLALITARVSAGQTTATLRIRP